MLPQPSLLVPVRIQTHVPSFGSITYTSVSQIVDNMYDSVRSVTAILQSQSSQFCGSPDPHHGPSQPKPLAVQTFNSEALDLSSAKLKTGFPLSLTSRTISTTNASSGGASKRMLSPASSLDMFIEVKQQKRVKEERMFGQIVEELSAVELGKCQLSEKKSLKMQTAPAAHAQGESCRTAFVDLYQKVTEAIDQGAEASSSPPHVFLSVSEVKVQMETGAQLISHFPRLRTTTGVSWCYLNFTKPSCSHADTALSSVYATWCAISHNPNPLELSTSAALALLQSRQKGEKVIYTMAAMCPPGTGKLVSSLLLWRQSAEQVRKGFHPSVQRLMHCEWKDREASANQTAPSRIKIFEGGYKSNEEYVYVRGRGRGKYICEECGIRCKKPSMLKKHIRTHTDVRPYVCRVCNFAFKTKGNLTKHMKSKAHMKKCLELGVSFNTYSKAEVAATTKHQFSDAEDSDIMDEEADEIEEDEDEDEDYEGDSTPKLRSRSTSPQLCGATPLSVTSTATVHGCSLASLSGPDTAQPPPSRRSDHPRVSTFDHSDKSMDEDSLAVLSPDQTNALFDPYSSCLLSPGWESPIREPSPSCLRFPSPRRELPARGRSYPRWDPSPLRPNSPSFKSIQHPSPVSLERSTSPGTELVGKRECSVRGRQRVVLRAVSPRRGSHQHKGGGDKTRHQTKLEMSPLLGALDVEMVRIRTFIPLSGLNFISKRLLVCFCFLGGGG
uniref:C2H2-type domain-containing protein n=1 Tax=Oryzias latipes TaxID=8090 RepID=A0A3P9IPJ9_ORYLA